MAHRKERCDFRILQTVAWPDSCIMLGMHKLQLGSKFFLGFAAWLATALTTACTTGSDCDPEEREEEPFEGCKITYTAPNEGVTERCLTVELEAGECPTADQINELDVLGGEVAECGPTPESPKPLEGVGGVGGGAEGGGGGSGGGTAGEQGSCCYPVIYSGGCI